MTLRVLSSAPGSSRARNQAALLILMVLACLAVSTAAARKVSAAPFPDVAKHWAEVEIGIVHANAIVSGYPGGAFRPDLPVTRAELVKMLVCALRLGDEADRMKGATLPALYQDVTASDWYLPYLVVATERGLVKGYDDGTFGGDREVTRAELAVLLRRALPGPTAGGGETFTDQADIPSWACDDIACLVGLGMIRGYGDGTFRPSQGATRAEAAVLIVRLLGWRGDLVQVRGSLRGWIVGDLDDAPLPDAVLMTVGGMEVSVAVSDGFTAMSAAGPASWRSLRAGQDMGLILGDDGRALMAVVRLEGDGSDILDPSHFLRPRRDGGI